MGIWRQDGEGRTKLKDEDSIPKLGVQLALQLTAALKEVQGEQYDGTRYKFVDPEDRATREALALD